MIGMMIIYSMSGIQNKYHHSNGMPTRIGIHGWLVRCIAFRLGRAITLIDGDILRGSFCTQRDS